MLFTRRSLPFLIIIPLVLICTLPLIRLQTHTSGQEERNRLFACLDYTDRNRDGERDPDEWLDKRRTFMAGELFWIVTYVVDLEGRELYIKIFNAENELVLEESQYNQDDYSIYAIQLTPDHLSGGRADGRYRVELIAGGRVIKSTHLFFMRSEVFTCAEYVDSNQNGTYTYDEFVDRRGTWRIMDDNEFLLVCRLQNLKDNECFLRIYDKDNNLIITKSRIANADSNWWYIKYRLSSWFNNRGLGKFRVELSARGSIIGSYEFTVTL